MKWCKTVCAKLLHTANFWMKTRWPRNNRQCSGKTTLWKNTNKTFSNCNLKAQKNCGKGVTASSSVDSTCSELLSWRRSTAVEPLVPNKNNFELHKNKISSTFREQVTKYCTAGKQQGDSGTHHIFNIASFSLGTWWPQFNKESSKKFFRISMQWNSFWAS